MANLVYKRVSTDQQSTDRQNVVLDEAGIEDPVVFEEDPGTSSRLHPLERPKFGELLTYARPGDTVHISEMFRLVRGTQHVLDVLDVLHRDRLALRIHDGAFSAMDLTARHPRTGELLSTVKFMVQTLAAAGELQRDLQRELTYDGLRAAEAKGNKGGRRPAVTAAKAVAVRAGYLGGRSIAGLARDHHVSRGAIRTAVADLMPEHTTAHQDDPVPEPVVTLDMPGKVADFLRTTDLEPAERDALDQGVTVRRGQGYTLRVTAAPSVIASFGARSDPDVQRHLREALHRITETACQIAGVPTAICHWEDRGDGILLIAPPCVSAETFRSPRQPPARRRTPPQQGGQHPCDDQAEGGRARRPCEHRPQGSQWPGCHRPVTMTGPRTRPDELAYVDRLAVTDLGRSYKQRMLQELDVRAGQTVLDLGCGPGTDLGSLADAAGPGGVVIGVDRDQKMVDAARERTTGRPDVDVCLGDVYIVIAES